ncbi:aspartate/glutamate racemase family protein [Aquabacterium sp. A08]|uniref:aspartate/glutamate racemase family protein n=1 Tax=Aquabacterium sp. A08 TaxID=2718532 RepID=UPI001422CDCF|nr:aspartate/glutamate racemase family protein [Aquabacterium sp. A08]NIC41732.1 Asp/Glu racemase [Aquabacterium sp. A08]NIC42368.1 Asp/Glu racemase [Aquabacterium sp. A08]NIC42915.1 Asp/Glu racemase [Aquabacterium sp. A08]
MTRTLLLINPNTTAAITDTVAEHLVAAGPLGVRVQAVTARFGAPYIACETSYAVAAHATLDAWQRASAAGPAPAGIVIACFGDPGLLALRERAACPVTGLAEAAVAEAAVHGRVGIVTGGHAWRPMLQRLLPALAGGDRVAAIETVALSGAELRADPQAAQDLLVAACARVLDRHRVDAIVVGGAGLAGLAEVMQPRVPVPLIDSVAAAARWVWRAPASAGLGRPTWWPPA